jgi:addiction module RelE/StbE family toxin
MIYRVDITDSAEMDLLDAAVYIAQTLSNKTAANYLLDKAEEANKSLSENPKRQPLVNDAVLATKGLRSMPVNNYLLFYVVREKTRIVTVLRFVHSRRNWIHLFDEADFESAYPKSIPSGTYSND